MVEGRKAVKFAEPIVQGTLITHLRFSCIHVCSLTFVPIAFFGGPHLWRQLPCDDMATGFDAPCHLRFFLAAMLRLTFGQARGNWSYFNMATVVAVTWQIQFSTHGNWICHIMPPAFFLPCCIFSYGIHMASGADTTWQLQLLWHGTYSTTRWQLQCNYMAIVFAMS